VNPGLTGLEEEEEPYGFGVVEAKGEVGTAKGDATGAVKGDATGAGAVKGDATGAVKGDATGAGAVKGDATGAVKGDATGAVKGDAGAGAEVWLESGIPAAKG
jgi:hypothetical protein